MTHPTRPQISARKQPQQSRSTDLVEAVLEAAVQVLAREGAQRFTMARVAEKAGVSVGSLYQYFPNKASILFRLQCDEWRQTAEMLNRILDDPDRAPMDRLRRLVHEFIRSECEEAAMRVALHDAAPLYRDAPEALEAKESSKLAMEKFLSEVLPKGSAEDKALAGELIEMTLGSVGESFSETVRTEAEIERFAGAVGEMLVGYLEKLAK